MSEARLVMSKVIHKVVKRVSVLFWRSRCNANEGTPLTILRRLVADNLSAIEIRCAIKNLLGRLWTLHKRKGSFEQTLLFQADNGGSTAMETTSFSKTLPDHQLG
jgi:hypothetical protein